jgi:hypothetical protein
VIYSDGKTLHVDVMQGSRILYTIPLVDLYGSELKLNGGRFEHFTHKPQEFKVLISFPRQNGEEFRHAFKERLEWIAEQSNAPWSFSLLPEFVGRADVEFTFENVTTAVVFKLVWF